MADIGARRVRVLLAAIILLGLALRVGFASTLEEKLYWPDPRYYDMLAWTVVSGQPLPDDAVKRAPLHAFVIAVPYALAGRSYRAAYLFQAVLGGVLMPVLIFLIGARLKGRAVGLLAALMAAVYPYYVYSSGTLYATQTTTIALLLLAYLAVLSAQARRVWPHLLQGVALGASILARSISLVLVPLAVLWTWPARGLARGLVVAAVAVAVVAPWTIRNYRATGEFIAVSVGGGREFLYGVSPGATGSSQSRTAIADDIREARSVLTQAEWDRECFRRGLEIVRSNPARYARLYGAKFLNLYRFYPGTMTSNEFTGARTNWIAALTYGPVLLFGLAGIWFERRRWVDYAPLLGIIIGFSLAYPAFTTCVRYRLPIDAYFMLFAAVALSAIITRLGGWPARFLGSLEVRAGGRDA